jgi:hypothetical protein
MGAGGGGARRDTAPQGNRPPCSPLHEPMRMPPGRRALLSPGTVFLFTARRAASSTVSTRAPSMPFGFRFTRTRWLSVPPDTSSYLGQKGPGMRGWVERDRAAQTSWRSMVQHTQGWAPAWRPHHHRHQWAVTDSQGQSRAAGTHPREIKAAANALLLATTVCWYSLNSGVAA